MKRCCFVIMSLCLCVLMHAQIGYQVSLLNTETGEPRANERVTAEIKLHNCDEAVVYSETQTGVTNDFGVLSFSIGNAQSLASIDWSNYPMFISVTVDGVLIGKTQIMSVPYANAVVPLSKDLVVGTWSGSGTIIWKNEYRQWTCFHTFIFQNNGTMTYRHNAGDYEEGQYCEWNGIYKIEGNEIICISNESDIHNYPYHPEYENGYLNFVRIIVLKYIDGNLYFTADERHPPLTKQ